MGGDFAPQATLTGALQALTELEPDHTIQLVGHGGRDVHETAPALGPDHALEPAAEVVAPGARAGEAAGHVHRLRRGHGMVDGDPATGKCSAAAGAGNDL